MKNLPFIMMLIGLISMLISAAISNVTLFVVSELVVIPCIILVLIIENKKHIN